MGKEILFGNIEIEKNKFYSRITPIFFGDVHIEKKLLIALLITCTMLIKSNH